MAQEQGGFHGAHDQLLSGRLAQSRQASMISQSMSPSQAYQSGNGYGDQPSTQNYAGAHAFTNVPQVPVPSFGPMLPRIYSARQSLSYPMSTTSVNGLRVTFPEGHAAPPPVRSLPPFSAGRTMPSHSFYIAQGSMMQTASGPRVPAASVERATTQPQVGAPSLMTSTTDARARPSTVYSPDDSTTSMIITPTQPTVTTGGAIFRTQIDSGHIAQHRSITSEAIQYPSISSNVVHEEQRKDGSEMMVINEHTYESGNASFRRRRTLSSGFGSSAPVPVLNHPSLYNNHYRSRFALQIQQQQQQQLRYPSIAYNNGQGSPLRPAMPVPALHQHHHNGSYYTTAAVWESGSRVITMGPAPNTQDNTAVYWDPPPNPVPTSSWIATPQPQNGPDSRDISSVQTHPHYISASSAPVPSIRTAHQETDRSQSANTYSDAPGRSITEGNPSTAMIRYQGSLIGVRSRSMSDTERPVGHQSTTPVPRMPAVTFSTNDMATIADVSTIPSASGLMDNPTGPCPQFSSQMSQRAVDMTTSVDKSSSNMYYNDDGAAAAHSQSAVPNPQVHMYNASARPFPSSLPVSTSSSYPEFDTQDPILTIANVSVRSSTTYPPSPNQALHHQTPTTHSHLVESSLTTPAMNLSTNLSTHFTVSTRDQITSQRLQASHNVVGMPTRSPATDNRRRRVQYRVRGSANLVVRHPRPSVPFSPPPSSNPTVIPPHEVASHATMATNQVSEPAAETALRHFDPSGLSELQPRNEVPASLDVASPQFKDSTSTLYNGIATDSASVTQSAGTSAGSRTRFQNHTTTTSSSSSSVDTQHPFGISSTELEELRKDLQSQDWVRFGNPEPPILDTERIFYNLFSQNLISSRFDVFYKPSYSHRCLFQDNGESCSHKVSDKELAQDHARKHFNYAPFKCNGDCSTRNCNKTFRCSRRLNEHIQRIQDGHRICEKCGNSVTTSNLARHKKQNCKPIVSPSE